MAKVKKECKVLECKHPAKKAGFCGWCHKKYEKGIYDLSGELSYKEVVKQAAKKRRLKKREEKKRLEVWQAEKEEIKSRLVPSMLKVLQEEHPETRATIHCKALEICISEVACFGRIYLKAKQKECNKCHIHDSRMKFLKDFVDKEESKHGGK